MKLFCVDALNIQVIYNNGMETTALAYQSVMKRILDKVTVGSIPIVNHNDFVFSTHQINQIELDYVRRHAANKEEFLKGVLQERLGGVSTFDPYLEPCPVEKLLCQRLENETAKLNVLRIAKTRLAKYKHRGILSNTPLVSYDGASINPTDRRESGK